MQIPKMFSLAVRRFMLQIDLNNKFDCTQTVSVCVCVCVCVWGRHVYFVSLSELKWSPSGGKQHHLWGCNYAAILQNSQEAACRPRCSLCIPVLRNLRTYTTRHPPHTRAHTHIYIYTQNESELRLLNKRHISVVFTEDSSTHDSGESTGVHYKMNEGWIPFSCFTFSVLVLFTLALCHTVTAHRDTWTETEPSFKLIMTHGAFFLL